MCMNFQPLIDAIGVYLAKADDDLEDTFEEEGRALPEDTVKSINDLKTGVAAVLLSETDYFINEIKKRKTLNELMDVFEEIKANDAYGDEIKTVVSDKLHEIVPPLVKEYVRIVDSEIKITAISKRAYDWIETWSGDLSKLMKLKTHEHIETILKKGLETGSDISSVTLDIMNSKIRDKYYRARTVAVTEILRAHNVAKWEAAMQNPSVTGKKWRHTGAHKNEPRENHVAMDGQVVAVAEPFTLEGADGNTYYPMYPVDTLLPAGESVNCHCIAEDIVDEEILNMPLEERQELQRQIIAEMDNEWEKELDERNRARAGIEEDL